MILTYDILDEYFRSVATTFRLINSFSGFTDLEFDQVISEKKKNKYPMMTLSPYRFELSGNKQRAFSNKKLVFAIGIKLKQNTVSEHKKAEAMAEEIGLQVIARIKKDSKNKNVAWLYENFDVNSVKAESLGFDTRDGIKGMEFSFEFLNRQPLVVQKHLWIDLSRLAFSYLWFSILIIALGYNPF